jgi:outer membrane protein assembly factor BamB
VLNAIDGTVLWSRNIATDTGAKDSGWGFTSSPLVIDSNVIVAATGKLVAYYIATGEQRWFGPEAGKSYSSPQLMMFDGISQILMISDSGATSLSPSEGKLLWRYQWKIGDPVLQPAMTEDGEILITGSMTDGMRRLSVAKETTGWIIKERWKLSGLKPYFNDFVIHKGHAYGFNGRSLACIDLKNGKRNWQGGRYGGQILLLADQDLLLVLSEKGELALVAATPDKFTQLAQFPAITGKTWNHPVLAGDVLVVRNSEEMAAFRLSLSGS